jgi:hypothetical protein
MASTAAETHRTSLLFKAILGGMASLCAATVTHPIELIKIRFQIQNRHELGDSSLRYRNFPQALDNIVRSEGFRGLYKGITAQWFKESIYSTLRLGSYEPLRNYLSNGALPA